MKSCICIRSMASANSRSMRRRAFPNWSPGCAAGRRRGSSLASACARNGGRRHPRLARCLAERLEPPGGRARRCRSGTAFALVWADMQVQSFANARQMEVWAHGQDIHDLLGIAGSITTGSGRSAIWACGRMDFFATHGLERPMPPAVILTTPGGDTWTWNEGGREQLRGSAATSRWLSPIAAMPGIRGWSRLAKARPHGCSLPNASPASRATGLPGADVDSV